MKLRIIAFILILPIVSRTSAGQDMENQDKARREFVFLSDAAYLQGDYINAIRLIDSAIVCNGTRNGARRMELDIKRAQSLFMLKDYRSASASLGSAYEYAYWKTENFTAMSECGGAYALSLAYCGKFQEALDLMDKICSETSGQISSERLLEMERRRAKILILRAESIPTPSPEDYTEVIKTYKNYFKLRKSEISSKFSTLSSVEREQFWMTQRQFIVDCYRLGGHAPELIYDAALFNKNLLLQFSARNSKFEAYVWQDVQKGLPPGGAAIEFIQYRRDSSLYMAAVVVTKKSVAPVFIELGRADCILSHRLQNGMSVQQAIATDNEKAKALLYSRDSELPQIIWNQKLTSQLAGCSNIYFSADGFLHQLAIEYLYPADNAPVFHRLTSTRNVCRGCAPVRIDDAPALICGAIDFQASLGEETNNSNDTSAFLSLAQKGFYFQNLDWSGKEIDSILTVRPQHLKDSVLRGSAATEKKFKQIAGNYRLVHLSTHGYFNGRLEVPVEDLQPQKTDNTLSQSVIFFSGANANLHDKAFNPSGLCDGLVSARELSDLDMSKVGLCVVAACQTGLGDVTADGVYGIQRGLKNAGTGAMLLSLWSVDDKATSLLMSSLYKHIAQGEDVSTAFHNARKDLAEYTETVCRYSVARMTHRQTKVKGYYKNPFYTDAFILIDDVK